MKPLVSFNCSKGTKNNPKWIISGNEAFKNELCLFIFTIS